MASSFSQYHLRSEKSATVITQKFQVSLPKSFLEKRSSLSLPQQNKLQQNKPTKPKHTHSEEE
jgi:hypothetical protein